MRAAGDGNVLVVAQLDNNRWITQSQGLYTVLACVQRGMQQMMEQFESLTIGGAAPGQESVNINELPRPVGDFQV
jgi:hypothetical protein